MLHHFHLGVLPLGDALLASAWAEMHLPEQQQQQQRGAHAVQSAGGAAATDTMPLRGMGWGVGLYTQPSAKDLELGVVLGQHSGAGCR